MAASGTVRVETSLNQQLTAGTTIPTTTNVPCNVTKLLTFASGTAANQVNKVAYYTGTANATPTDINLFTLTCLDGSSGFTAIRGLVVINSSTTDGQYLLLGGNTATNPWTAPFSNASDIAILHPGAAWVYEKPLGSAGSTVDTNTKTFRVDPGAAAITFELVALGA